MADSAEIVNTKAAPRGRVLAADGSSVTGAEVMLYHRVNYWGLGNRVVEKVTTDAQGRFAFAEPLTFTTPSGTDRHDHYILIATHEKFAPAWTHILGGTPEQSDFQLHLTSPRNETFEVVDLQRQSVAGASVWLQFASAQGDRPPIFTEHLVLPEDLGLSHGVTDAAGRVTLTNLPDTKYGIIATKPGFELQHQWEPGPDGTSRFRLRPEGKLEGRVLDPRGEPVEGATVWVHPKWSFHTYCMAKTDREGRYSIEKIYTEGRTEGSGHYRAGIRDSRFTAATRDVFFARGLTVTDFDIQAIPGTEILGRLLDPTTRQPMAGGEVYIDSPSGRQTKLTDAVGEFRCRVADGDIHIFFGAPPGGCYSRNRHSSKDFHATVDANACGGEWPVTLYAPDLGGKLGTIRGKVVDASGAPMAYCQVAAAVTDKPKSHIETSGWTGNIFRGNYTDPEGAFTLSYPVGLEFTLVVHPPAGNASGTVSSKLTSDSLDLVEPLVLQSTTSADLVLVDLSGTPRANLGVEVMPQAGSVDLWLNRKELTTDADGRLRLDSVASGLTYRIGERTKAHRMSPVWTIFDPSHPTPTLLLTDRFILRIADREGRPTAIKRVRHFFIWILHDGKRVRWTNNVPETLDRLGADVTLPRETFGLGHAGETIEILVETESGAHVRASGLIPNPSVGILELRECAE